jgi:hypothetical protein
MSERAGPAWTDIAASAYKAYAASTNNKNFRGEEMPAFEDLPIPIRTAWQAAVRQVDQVLQNPELALGAEIVWTNWVPPSA